MSSELHELTGAYALDALPEDEQARFEEHLESCAACRREVAELQAAVAGVGELLEQAPPAGLKERVLADIDQVPQEAPRAPAAHAEPGAPPPTAPEAPSAGEGPSPGDELGARRAARRPWWAGLQGVAAAVVAVLVVGLGTVIVNLYDRIDELETASSQVTEVLSAPDADTITVEGEAGSSARVVVSASRGEAVFLADGMDQVSAEQTYELWLIDDAGAEPAGLFDVDEQGRATQVLTGDLESAAAIGVTVEPAGGSPQPTSDPVMVIELADA